MNKHKKKEKFTRTPTQSFAPFDVIKWMRTHEHFLYKCNRLHNTSVRNATLHLKNVMDYTIFAYRNKTWVLYVLSFYRFFLPLIETNIVL